MGNKLLLGLCAATGAVLLVLVSFLAGAYWRQPTNPNGAAATSSTNSPGQVDAGSQVVAVQGSSIGRKEVPDPPPPPKPVANPDRVRQNLQPGKTYVTHTKGTLNVRATDKDWGVEEVVTLNYAFEARIDREIESNDGKTIVELRHFRDVRSLKVECRLEDIRLEVGPAGDLLLAGIAYLNPELVGPGAALVRAVDGAHLKPVLDALRWAQVSPEQLGGLDKTAKAFAAVDRLTGKSVRLTYIDGQGVTKVEPVKGEMTAAERDFHMASVLVSDSLIVPDADVKVGIRWSVDGSNFANLIDPSMLARTSGELVLERAPDHLVRGEACRRIQCVEGRILLDDSSSKEGKVGHFEPRGSLFFSPKDQVIVEARLHGSGKLDRFSKGHLLFETRMRRLPELDVVYTCRVTDTLKAR